VFRPGQSLWFAGNIVYRWLQHFAFKTAITIVFSAGWRFGLGDAISLGYAREVYMIALLSITILTLTTLFALAAASALHWLLLRLAFQAMRPAAGRRVAARPELVSGTVGLTRAFVGHR
jgi:hypothetical protein